MITDMHYGATPAVFSRARQLRANLTPAEKLLWEYLKGSRLGYKFRQQHPMMCYVVDFYCHTSRLVVEIDGTIHTLKDVKMTDAEKEQNIKACGVTLIRFSNKDVFDHTVQVVEIIQQKLNELRTKRFHDNPDLYREECID